jgi:hypothetical protein
MIPTLPAAAQLPPSGSATPQQITLATDGDDPQGLSQSCMSYYQSNFHDVATSPMWLLCSMGEDERLGMYYPGDVTGTSGFLGAIRTYSDETPSYYQSLRDNITNLNLKPGGK